MDKYEQKAHGPKKYKWPINVKMHSTSFIIKERQLKTVEIANSIQQIGKNFKS